MKIRHRIVATLAFAVPVMAYASAPIAVPEPETYALLGIGAVALVIARRHRRK